MKKLFLILVFFIGALQAQSQGLKGSGLELNGVGLNSSSVNFGDVGLDYLPSGVSDIRTTLVVEYDSRSGITLSGSKATTWLSTIDTLSARQSTDANRPTFVSGFFNGRNVLKFLSGQHMTFTEKTLSSYTIIIIYKSISFSVGGANYILGGNSQGIFSSIQAIGAGYGEYDGTRVRSITYSAIDTNWNIRVFQNTKLYSNGVEGSYNNAQNLTGLTVGTISSRSDNPLGLFYSGYIALIRVYSSSLSSDELTQLYNFLKLDWGVN